MTNKDAVVKYKREEAKRKRLAAEAAAAEKERIRLEEIDIQKQIEAGIFTGAKGGKISKNGITRMAHGGGIELRGKTRGRIT